MKELEKRVQELEDIEAIKRLKGKYIRCVDRKLWQGLEECFVEDAEAHYGDNMDYIGRNAILDFLKGSLVEGVITSSHECHTPEIEITGDGTARGIWKFHDYIVLQQKPIMAGWAYYDDVYIKVNGKWKIKVVSYTRDYQETIKQ
ncbi:MAG: nuclear transport factor 2 family protein [Chloroflexota bacterium]|nr:nuclear transport factor 2 family protein [Chloroflexota bacterium]